MRARIFTFTLLASFACSSDPADGGPSGSSSGTSTRKDGAADGDGIKNGTETDVDCGGPDRPKCTDGKTCNAGNDCVSGLCRTTCQTQSSDDGVMNGSETDVDCGGSSGKKCGAGQRCRIHADCASDGCDFAKTCAVARSCTEQAGGATCGEGSVADPARKHETCCKALPVDRPAAQGGPFVLDKYLVTAGRMRAFIERTNGNPRAFVQTLPEGGFIGWKHAWDVNVPSTPDAVHLDLGNGPNRTGCDLSSSRARTYWMPDAINAQLAETGRQPADARASLDAKVLNCATLWLVYALCAWDGARLASVTEILYAWQAGTTRAYPWGAQANDATRSSDNEVHEFPIGLGGHWVDVPEPGRYPLGYGQFGHADLVGTVFHFTRDLNVAGSQYLRVNSGSWETEHAITPNASQTASNVADWAYGGRCARETAN